MNDGYTFSGYTAFVDMVRKLCRPESTGTLFVVTDANQMARIELEAGRFTAINFMHKRGAEALSLLTRIRAGRARFSEGLLSSTQRAPLPPPSDILAYLDGAQTLAPPPAAEMNGAASSLTPADRAVLEALLAHYIGPVAAVICDEHLAGATDLNVALDALAAEIGDVERARSFTTEARERLTRG